MVIDGYEILPVKTELVGYDKESKTSTLEMTLFEGRNRQIRKMCDTASLNITRLSRISMGSLSLGELPLGKWRYLTEEETNYIKNNS